VMHAVCTATFAFDDENVAATENAVSALGKLCKRHESIAQGALPLWLSFLPIQHDKQEARVVHAMLIELVQASNTALLGASMERLPAIICVFGRILYTDKVEPEASAQIAALLKQVHGGMPHVLQSLPQSPEFAKLTPEERGSLEKAISS